MWRFAKSPRRCLEGGRRFEDHFADDYDHLGRHNHDDRSVTFGHVDSAAQYLDDPPLAQALHFANVHAELSDHSRQRCGSHGPNPDNHKSDHNNHDDDHGSIHDNDGLRDRHAQCHR